jgi:hypothetical protein
VGRTLTVTLPDATVKAGLASSMAVIFFSLIDVLAAVLVPTITGWPTNSHPRSIADGGRRVLRSTLLDEDVRH